TAIERITFEPAPNGTVVVLWGNGAIRPESYKRVSLSDPAREVIQVRGMTRPFSPVRIQAGTGELRQIRVGYHQKGGGNELHIVLDLEGPRVKVVRIEPDGQRLRIHLQGA
ncbi:MAG TPA: AMIN domain-containing protein, partial [Thermoanaerobaculia bacterium]|nr:AMIN domain-containing protein [Thermoanaerobaculia bacterium]